jgi:hypothetical protein
MLDAHMKRRAGLMILGIACVLVHLLVGLYYATHLTSQTQHPSLAAHGDAYLASFTSWDTDSEQDVAGFNRTALSILSRGLPYSRQGTLILRTAVYSYFVAGCYTIGGIRLLPVAIAQAIVSGLTCWLLALATSNLFPKNTAAPWIVGGLYLVNLRVAMYVGYVVPLVPTLLFTAVALWAATQITRRRAVAWFVASLILATYTSSTFFVVAMTGALWLLQRRRSIAGFTVIVSFVALKFILTWSNAAGSTTESNRAADRGGVFWTSNNPYYESMRPWSPWEWRTENMWSTWKMSEEEHSRYTSYLDRGEGNELRATLLWIRENPLHYLWVCLVRLRTEFGPYTGQMSPRNRLISTVVWLLIFPAGFYGLWKSRRDMTAQFVQFVVITVFIFATFVSEEPYLRYRMPVDLLLTAFAGLSYGSWLTRKETAETNWNISNQS